ncbi:MAG TPA: GIY-YIG nuclease family protein [Asanoa sp.]
MRADVGALPREPGVYRFRDRRGRALYVGRAADLRRRVASYWGDLGNRPHLAPMVRAVARVEAVVCASEHEAAWLERNLLEHRQPPANRTAGGQEVPVLISLGDSGLTVVHATRPGGVHFGPYLGGLRVRLAVSALHRIHPLPYAAARLTDAERSLAGLRGVSPADRHALVKAVSAILGRDPAAVAAAEAALVARRDRAAERAAYELAAQVQQEIEALAWVVAPQRVTTVSPDDLDVHGWHDGLLVSFAVRGGRLREWRLRPCTAARSAALVAATPPAWSPFAARNAVLAATLRATTG